MFINVPLMFIISLLIYFILPSIILIDGPCDLLHVCTLDLYSPRSSSFPGTRTLTPSRARRKQCETLRNTRKIMLVKDKMRIQWTWSQFLSNLIVQAYCSGGHSLKQKWNNGKRSVRDNFSHSNSSYKKGQRFSQ